MFRFRPSPLLRIVALLACLACLALLIGTIWMAGSLEVAGSMFAAAVFVWLFGVEGGLIPWAIAYFASHSARGLPPGEPIRSRWVIDAEIERRRALQKFHDDTQDNPTIR